MGQGSNLKARCHKYQNTCKAQEKESKIIVLGCAGDFLSDFGQPTTQAGTSQLGRTA